jgi:hypothetical protein
MVDRLAKTTHLHDTAHAAGTSNHGVTPAPGKSTLTEHLYAPQDKYNKTPVPAHQRPAVFGEDPDAHIALAKSATRYQMSHDGVTATVSDKVPAHTRVAINPSVQPLKRSTDADPQEFVLVWAGIFGSAWMLPDDIVLEPTPDATQKTVPTSAEIANEAKAKSAQLKPAKASTSARHTKQFKFRMSPTPTQLKEEAANERILPHQSGGANEIGHYYLETVTPKSSKPLGPAGSDTDPTQYQTADGKARQSYNVSLNLPSANAAPVADDVAAPGETFFIEEDATPKHAPLFKHDVSLFKEQSQVKGKTAKQRHQDGNTPIGHELWVYGFIGMPNPNHAAAQHEPELPNPHRRGWVPKRDLEPK